MDARNLNLVREIGKTQPAKASSGNKNDGKWRWLMALLGVVVTIGMTTLLLWWAGGVNGLVTLWRLNTQGQPQTNEVDNSQQGPPVYKNASVGYGFDYSSDDLIDQQSETETVVSSTADAAMPKEVKIIGIKRQQGDNGLALCAKGIDCKKILDGEQPFTNSKGLAGSVSYLSQAGATQSARLAGYVFDVVSTDYAKVVIWPSNVDSNSLALDLANRVKIAK